ncbi:ABC-2 family transporter protein [Patescibacteria group bacterium]|nr:ABC-2 family transporter protein [Patescibacteria group bacterium]
MKKYLAIARLSLQEDLVYRSNFFFYFWDQTLSFLVQVLLWTIVFKESDSIAGFDFNGIIQYFVIVRLIQIFTVSRIAYVLGDLIISGGLSRFLIRPWSFFWAMFSRQLGKKIYRFFYFSLVIAALYFFGFVQLSLVKILIFLVMLVNVSLLSFLYSFNLGALAFWATNITSLIWFFQQAADFLGGGWLPASFFPVWTLWLIKKLPFYLALGFPAEFFQGKMEPGGVLIGIGQQLIWIFIFFFLTALIWGKGVKQYEAVGN